MQKLVANPKQFNLSLSPDIKQRLEELAVEFQKGSGTKVAAEIIVTFIERWAIVESATRARRKQLLDEDEQRTMDYLQGKTHPPLLKQVSQPTRAPSKRKRNT